MIFSKDSNQKKHPFSLDEIKGIHSFFQRLSVLVLFILFNLVFVQNIQAETIITNTATADFLVEGNAQKLSDSVQFTKDSTLFKAILLSKEVDKELVGKGEVLTYTLTISNPNNQTINNIIVEDILPAGLVYEVDTAVLDGSTLLSQQVFNEGSQLTLTLGSLGALATWQVSYKLKVDESAVEGNAVNQAIVKSDVGNSAIAQASVIISFLDSSFADPLLLSKVSNKTVVQAGDVIRYSLTITNINPHEIKNIKVNDTLSFGLVYVTGSALLNNNAVTEDTNDGLVFSLGDIPADTEWTLVYDVIVDDTVTSGRLFNLAKVIAEDTHANSSISGAVVNLRTPSTIEFLKVDGRGVATLIPPASFDESNAGNWQEIKSITLADGSVISLPSSPRLIDAQEYTPLEPIIIQVKDYDQNLDYLARETVIITINISDTNDIEILRLTETSPDSGVFRGAIQATTNTSSTHNGVLTLANGANINVNYRDDEDNTDTSATAALVVPNINNPEVKLSLNKTADKTEAGIGELVRYTLSFTNTTAYTIPTLRLEDTLPVGFRYLANSATLNGLKLQNEVSTNGRLLNFNLRDMPNSKQWTLEYVAKITAGVQIGQATNEAQLIIDQSRSNIARASVKINDDLMRSRNILTGRVYIGCENDSGELEQLNNARIYLETGRNVLSDEDGFWHMEGVMPGSHVLQLDIDSLPDGFEPLLCNDNTQNAGNAASKFVDLQAGGLWQVDFHVKKPASQKSALSQPERASKRNPFELFGDRYLETASDDFEILWPKNNYVPSVASTKIVVKSPAKHTVEVFLNGEKVTPLNYDGSNKNKAKTVTIRRWAGVDIDIKRRDNALLVIQKDESGKEIGRKKHNIHFSGNPASAELLVDQSTLIADGKTTPTIALLVKDADGYPMRAHTHGYYTLESNHVPKVLEDKGRLSLNGSATGSYKYLIGEGGIAHIKLEPTAQSGEVKINLQFTRKELYTSKSTHGINREQALSVWLKPHLRNWILVGIVEGTLAHQSLSGNMKTLNDLGKDDSFYKRGRVAFFAKGRIKGKYLLTLSYDSHKQKQQVGSQLEGTIDPDAWYTVYGDNSISQHDAPSSRKLYVKLEKDNFYALFGDYHTGLTVTELAGYERVLNGIKTEFTHENYSVNAFVSEVSDAHHHQEIQGDGTSGLYYLSRNIVSNSETIQIETRDRFHSDKVIKTRKLIRYQDYEIDYDAGTLFFKFPVTGRDQHFNPNIIVADYDSDDESSNKSITAGGRVAVKAHDDRLEVGVSALHEGRNEGDADQLIAGDVTYRVNSDTKIHAEIATSKTEKSNFENSHAYIIELEKEIENMEARLYLKERDENFGIGSQASEDGTQKAGAELRYRISDKTNLNAEVSQQLNLLNDNKRQLAEIGVDRHFDKVDLNAGLRHSKEETSNVESSNNTVLLGGNYVVNDGKISLRSNIEKNIGSSNQSERSPDRAVVGVDIRLKEGLTVFAEHETTTNKIETTHNNRVGVNKSLWQGAEAKTTYTQERSASGRRNYATLGLSQKIQLTDKIHADFSIDQAKTLGVYQRSERFHVKEPRLQGAPHTGDYTAFSVGLGANGEDVSWTSRLEMRNGENENKINFRAGVVKQLEDGKSLNAKLSHSQSENNNGGSENRLKLSLGAAWHPKKEDFILLSRLDLIDEEGRYSGFDGLDSRGGIGRDNHTQKVVSNMHYSRKVNNKTQFNLHHGIKYVKESNNETQYNTTVDTASVEFRRDINTKWDVGAHGGYLFNSDDSALESVAGVSVGVTPLDNAWLSVGYNFEGFDDKDFDESSYKSKGLYMNLRYKVDQDSFAGNMPIRGESN